MDIKDIKQRLSITTVLNHYHLKVENNKLCCPFHQDKTPSMQVYTSTNTVYCFSGNCMLHGKAIDTIDFIMHKEHITKGEAIKKAKQLTGEILPQQITKIKAMDELAQTAVLTKVYSYFKNGLKSSKPARDYIEQRGLRYEALEMGFNSGQYHHQGRSKDEAFIKSCIHIGLLTPHGTNTRVGGQAYRVFGKDCIVFALKNKHENITGLYFRSVLDKPILKHLYLTEGKGLYPCYPKKETEKLIITESIIDAATLLQVSEITYQYSVLAAYGTNRLTEQHIEAIKELPNLKEIIFAFDGDDAGRKATASYANLLKEVLPSVELTTISLEEGEDLNSIGISHEKEVFIHLLEKRTAIDFSLSIGEELLQPITPVVEQSNNLPALAKGNPFKIVYRTDNARYYVQGGVGKLLDSMKVTLVIENEEGYKSRSKLDLYEDKQVEKLSKDASERLDIRRDLIEQDLYRLTDLLDKYREESMQDAKEENEQDKIVPLTEKQKQAIKEFGAKPNLVQRLNDLLGKTGIVGEEQNRIFLLLIAISHKMESPSHALIQGSSGSGKTKLLKQIVSCMPKEKVTLLTRMTDKALYNYAWNYFHNRLFCLEDMDGLSEEAEFALREFISSGMIRSSASVKDEQGNISTGEKYVEGPIASLACTTKGSLYEDNMGRVFLIAVDESLAQTKRIIEYQNKKAACLIDKDEEKRTAQFIEHFVRALKPYEVINPYANRLHLPEEAHKIRRLNDLFQSFVKIVTMVNQYQRKQDSKGRLITEIEDLELAIEMMFECIVLKVDELDGSLRHFYERLKEYIKGSYKDSHEQIEFSLREIRQTLHLSKTQLFRFISELISLEYIKQSSGHSNRGFKYKIVYWDNYQRLRTKIKEDLQRQLKELGTLGNTSGTPE